MQAAMLRLVLAASLAAASSATLGLSEGQAATKELGSDAACQLSRSRSLMQTNMGTLKASAHEEAPIATNVSLEARHDLPAEGGAVQVLEPHFGDEAAKTLAVSGEVHQIWGYTLVSYDLGHRLSSMSNQSKWVLVLFIISGVIFSPLLYIIVIGPWQVSEGQFHNAGTNSSERLFGRAKTIQDRGQYQRRKSTAVVKKDISPAHTPPLVKESSSPPRKPSPRLEPDEQSDKRSGEQIPSPRLLSPTNESTAEAFCPDLIVPSDNVCQLVIPTRDWMVNDKPIDIKGQDGSSVVQVIVHDVQNADQGRTQVTLQTPTGDRLADCQMTSPEEFRFHNRLGEYSATLSPGDKSSLYQLLMPGGRTLIYRGNFAEFEMEITDSLGETLARTEKCIAAFDTEGRESYYGTILAPGTDVGLLVCGMLCAQILAMSTPKAAQLHAGSSASESSD